MDWVFIIIISLVIGIACYAFVLCSAVQCAKRKNRNIPLWFISGFLLPSSLLILEILKPLPGEDGAIVKSNPRTVEYFGMLVALLVTCGVLRRLVTTPIGTLGF